MGTIITKLTEELKITSQSYREKASKIALVKRILPKEILEYDGNLWVSVYHSSLSIGFFAPPRLIEIEEYHWAKQMCLYLDTIFNIKWETKPTCSKSSGNMWFNGITKCNNIQIDLTIYTAKPPTCKIHKIETKETKEVVTVRYEAECPPDLSEVTVGIIQNV